MPSCQATRKSEEEWQGSYGSTKSARTMGRNPLPCVAAPCLGFLKTIFLDGGFSVEILGAFFFWGGGSPIEGEEKTREVPELMK